MGQENASKSKLSTSQRAVIASLVAGQTKQEAARAVGIRPETVSRYLRDPLFRGALSAAQDGTLAQVVARMTEGTNQSLDTLAAVMVDPEMPPAVRVRAALGWLEQAARHRELVDLVERVEQLEERLRGDE